MTASEIRDKIREDIVNGRFQKERKLPTREEFSRHYCSSKATVQKALSELCDEGFVIARGSLGTFVNPCSPNVTDVAVLLPQRREKLVLPNQLHSLIERQHQVLENALGKHLKYFYIDQEQHGQDDFQAVALEASCTRLSGVIFPFAPKKWMLEPFIKHNIPVAVLTDEEVSGASTVWLDYTSFLSLSLDLCIRNGYKRPALLVSPTLPYHHVESYIRIAGEKNIAVDPLLIRGTHYSAYLKHTLMSLFHCSSPADSLILGDEGMLEGVFRDLLDLGLVPGKDIMLVSQRTFPRQTYGALPVHFIGFDIRKIIGACIEALDAVNRSGQNVQKFKYVPAEIMTEVI